MKLRNKINEGITSVFDELDRIYANESGRGVRTTRKTIKESLEPLNEEILNESIEDIYTRYYSDIDREKFDTLIALDPTFNADQDRLGTYGKWILAAYKKKNLREPEFRRVMEILNDFNERKRYLEKKDIFQYKTLQEIRTALDNIQLTDNQISKLNRKKKHSVDLGDEAEFVAEDSNWEIWTPKTYNASMKLGAGSTWCTASTSGDYWYNNYTRSGMLLIFLKKGNETGEKYQAHIDNNGKVTTFMDVADRPSIDFSDFIVKENLVDVLKGSSIPNVRDNTGIRKAENIIRIKNGEPYIYKGERRIDRALLPHIKEVVCDYSGLPEGAAVPQHLPAGLFSGATELEKVTLCPEIKGVHRNVFTNCPNVVIYIPRDANGKLNFAADPSEFDFYRSRVKPIK